MSFRTSCFGMCRRARGENLNAMPGRVYKFSPHPQRHMPCRLVEMTFSLVVLVQLLWYYV